MRDSWTRLTPDARQRLAAVGLGSPEALGRRSLGHVVTDCDSSWVRRVCAQPTDLYVKVYDYPSWRDRWRGALRTTFLRPSRARREFDALQWLRSHGFAAPQPVAVVESRQLGVLVRAILVTQAFPGQSLDELLPQLTDSECEAVLTAVERFVEAIHRHGFRDRNLDLRNLLARRDATGGWAIAKIDSPRFRLVTPGPAQDRLAGEDWMRLSRSIEALRRPRPTAQTASP